MPRCAVCRWCCDGDPSHKKDSRWAWMVCLGAATNLAFTVGLIYSFGVLLPVFMDHFKESRERTAWTGSLSIALLQFFGPFVGSLINRFGCRVVSMTGCLTCALSLTVASFADSLILLCVTYSVIGFGGSCAFLSSFVIVRKCFDKRRSIALGIASAGQGLGTTVLSQVLQELVTAVYWRNTLRIVAGSLILISFFGILYDPKIETASSRSSSEVLSSEESGRRLPTKRFTFHCSLWKVPVFRVLAATFFFFMFGRCIIYILLVKYAEDLGESSSASAKLIFFMGINVVLGRFACGFLCSFKRLDNWYILQGVLLVNGVFTMLLTLAQNYKTLVAYAVVFGFCDGAMATVFNIQVLTCVGQTRAASAYGLILMVGTVTAAVGSPLSGFTVDKLGSYEPTFYMAGGALVAASLIPCVLYRPQCVRTSETNGQASGLTDEQNTAHAQELEQRSCNGELCAGEPLKTNYNVSNRTSTEVHPILFVTTV